MREMAEALVIYMAIGNGLGITIAFLEGRDQSEIGLWGYGGTAVGFLAGLFLTICCSEEL